VRLHKTADLFDLQPLKGCKLRLAATPGMAESLNVIALISGGKDSFFSLLHCLQNGHKVVALANLYPAPVPSKHGAENAANHEEDHDLNSFMYQTVGHTVIPLYEEALGIPLYRQQISGTAVQTGTSYGNPDVVFAEKSALPVRQESRSQTYLIEEDETESLVPLLRRIMADYPSANALSTGALLSTYQRTRVESVALRLGLTPLSYLWKYPILPPGIQTSLLEDMMDVGLDARIVKVASGGLDESFLWQNVTSEPVMHRIERSMKRFGTDGDGAVLGEGGEFETLVIDGPASLFKGRIEIQEKDRRVVREGGGSAWLKIREATVVMKSLDGFARTECRIPDMLEPRFRNAHNALNNNIQVANFAEQKSQSFTPAQQSKLVLLELKPSSPNTEQRHTIHWEFAAQGMTSPPSITDETGKLIDSIKQRLNQSSLKPADIISSIIILRSMQDFASVNKVPTPFPQSRSLNPNTTPGLQHPFHPPELPYPAVTHCRQEST
jgi:diphthine-ammonia ligase